MTNEISMSDYLKSPQQTGGSSFSTITPEPEPSIPSGGMVSMSDYLKTPTDSTDSTSGAGISFGGHDESDRFTQIDPSENWLGKTWDYSNKPIQEYWGWGRYRHGAGGLERGIEKVASGLLTPLSLVTLAAFAPAGIVDGVAGTALKEGLTEGAESLGGVALDGIHAAVKTGAYADAVKAAQLARIAGKSIPEAVEANSLLKYPEFENFSKFLRSRGLKETDMLNESLARRGISRALLKAGRSEEQAVKIAKGVEGLATAGFGLFQLKGAVFAYPRLMDLLEQGNYDEASEYLVELGTGTFFGGAGVAGALHTLPDIFPSLSEKRNLPLSQSSDNLLNIHGQRDALNEDMDVAVLRRARRLTASMFDVAGLPIPAWLKEEGQVLYHSPTDIHKDHIEELLNKGIQEGGYISNYGKTGVLNQEPTTADNANKPFIIFRHTDAPIEITGIPKEDILGVVHPKEGETLRQAINREGVLTNESTIGEIQSFFKQIFPNKAEQELWDKHTYRFNAAMATGMSRDLAEQVGQVLSEAVGLQEYWRQRTQGHSLPPRTVEDIIREETDGVVAARGNARANQQRINELGAQIDSFNEQLKTALPEQVNRIQKQINFLDEEKQTLELRQPRLDRESLIADEWENPTELTYFRHYERLNKALNEASEPSQTPEEFNEKVRAKSHYLQDVLLLAQRFPYFRGSPVDLRIDEPIEYDPANRMSSFGDTQISRSAQGIKATKEAAARFESIARLSEEDQQTAAGRDMQAQRDQMRFGLQQVGEEAARRIAEDNPHVRSLVDELYPRSEWIPVTRGTIKGREEIKEYADTGKTWFIEGHGPESEAGAKDYARQHTQAAGGGEPTIVKGWVRASSVSPKFEGGTVRMGGQEGSPLEVDTEGSQFRTDPPETLQDVQGKVFSAGSTTAPAGFPTIGEVHQFPNGRKITYFSPEAYKKMDELLESTVASNGQVLAKDTVRWLKLRINMGYGNLTPAQRKDFLDIIDKGQSPTGELVTARHNIGGGKIAKRKGTAREELIHGWQHSLSESFSGHLPSSVIVNLYKIIPAGMQDHLKHFGYKPHALSWVLESASKMMSKTPEYLGITEEEQAEFLGKYFQAIKDRWGEKAFETLDNTTTRARKLKEDFLNASRQPVGSQPPPIPGAGAPVVGGVGGAGGGGPPKPPKPPGPPEDEYPYQHDPDWRKKFPPSTIEGASTKNFAIWPWQTRGLHRNLPPNINNMIEQAKLRRWKPEDIDYYKKQLDAYADVFKGFSPKQTQLFTALRKFDDDVGTDAMQYGVIHSLVDNHLHHNWGQNDEFGNDIREASKSGAFQINVAQARHRVFGNTVEGFLMGKKLKVHDPVAIIHADAVAVNKAIANRKYIESMQDSGVYDPEGFPMVVSMGRGTQLPAIDGSPAKVLINPNRIRNIKMKPAEILRLQNAGLLDTYIGDGRISDRTPQVNQGNVKGWIQATVKKISDMILENPLLAERKQHVAGWKSLEDFAKAQVQKISDFIYDILPEGGKPTSLKFSPDGHNYEPLDIPPINFNMAKYVRNMLFGKKVITPGDVARLKDYADMNAKYALGDVRYDEVSKLLQQEKEHLSPDIKQYLDKIYNVFGTDQNGALQRTPEGDWIKQHFATTVRAIHHAATNPEYPQLEKDLFDLRYVDYVHTSAMSEPTRTAIREALESFGKSLADHTPEDFVRALDMVKKKSPYLETRLNPITEEEWRPEAEARLKDINDRQKKKYYWAPKQHIPIDHPSFHGYNWMATMPDGTSVLADSDMAVSRYAYKYIVNRLGLEPSWLRKSKIGSAVLKAGAGAKQVILSGSPFHVWQMALRAMMLHMNPFVRPNPILRLDEKYNTVRGELPLLRLGVKNKLTIFTNRAEAEDHSVGVASHFNKDSRLYKVPIVNQYLRYSDYIHDFLFNRLIPTYKANSFVKMFDQYAKAHEDWSNDAVASAAAEHVNNAFGGQNWREMGRSSTTQDWFNVLALAPDWLESEMRFAGALFKGAGVGPSRYEPDSGKNIARNQVAQAAVVMWTTARVLNLLHTGNAHYESPFGLYTKDKKGRDIEVSVRTMPVDILHMMNDPWNFLIGRASPAVRTVEELYTGRSQWGQKLTPEEKYVDVISNLTPIWGQTGIKDITGLATSADVSWPYQVAKSSGATAQVYRTPAQKMAATLASERSEEGSMNPAKVAHHRLLLQLEDDVRGGRIQVDDVLEMVDKGGLPEGDAKKIIKNVKETAGEDPELARMYSRVSRLDFEGAVQVWNSANPKEKELLTRLIQTKAKSYLKKSKTDFTPEERAEDPMLDRARHILQIQE